MPALSFQEEWLDKLLSNTKQQTTRPQTDRIKVGDVCSVYNQQRRRITDKPLRNMTNLGGRIMYERRYPDVPAYHGDLYHAHFLGKVKITEVYDVLPIACYNRSTWAKKDGFDNFTCADTWFTKRYGESWMEREWTVIRWHGWIERYFEPKE